MPRLSLEERIKIIEVYYTEKQNATQTSYLLQVEKTTVIRLVEKFKRTGSVHDEKRSGRPSISKNTKFHMEIKDILENNKGITTRRVASSLSSVVGEQNFSHSTVWKALKEMGYKPYHPRLLHKLNEDDFDRRVEASENIINLLDKNDAIDNIIWSDEAIFKLNGHVNRHNCVYWELTQPDYMIQKEVNSPGVTVWCGISSNEIIGPYFFDGNVNSQKYLEMLQQYLWPKIKSKEFYFQQDGASSHYAKTVRNWLDKHMKNKWIGRRGFVEWPARSPDLTPADFFLWGHLKNKVYGKELKSLEDLKVAIAEEILKIAPEVLIRVCRSVRERFSMCIEKEGRHFENLK